MRRLVLLKVAEAIEAPDTPHQFQEAIAWFRARLPVTDAEYEALDEDLKKRAFTVAGVAQADLVTDVWKAIDDAVANGTTLEDFKASVGDQLTAAWGEDDPARLETIFRTNVQSAYGAGRYEQLTDPVVTHARPYWQFSSVLDDRTTDICASLNGTTLPADDPFWADHQPPLHFNCRSNITALTEEEADDEGITPGAPDIDADDGFGIVDTDWKPDFEDYPLPIAAVLRDKLKETG